MKMIYADTGKCLYCGACVGMCPQDALSLEEVVIRVDENKCIECLSCVKFCPVGAIYQKK